MAVKIQINIFIPPHLTTLSMYKLSLSTINIFSKTTSPLFHSLSTAAIATVSGTDAAGNVDTYASDDVDATKTAKLYSASDDGDDSITICEISKNRRVSVRSWQGRSIVDIREFYSIDDKQLPGKKGISLTMDQWKILREHIEEIDQVVSENN